MKAKQMKKRQDEEIILQQALIFNPFLSAEKKHHQIKTFNLASRTIERVLQKKKEKISTGTKKNRNGIRWKRNRKIEKMKTELTKTKWEP